LPFLRVVARKSLGEHIMGIDFLAIYGARRMRNYAMQPLLLKDGLSMEEHPEDADAVPKA
jgi:hypothetical protein